MYLIKSLQRKSFTNIAICTLFCFSLWSSFAHTDPNKPKKLSPKQLNEKIIESKEALKKNKNDKMLWRQLGKLYVLKREYEYAIEAFTEGLEDNKPDSYILLADLYHSRKQYFDEIRILNMGIAKQPKNLPLLQHLANAMLVTGKKNEAIEQYRKIISIQKQYEPAYWGLLDIFMQSNNHYESRIILGDMLKIFGEKQKTLALLCKLNTLDSYFESAIQYCQMAVSNDYKVAENHIYLGLTHKYLKNQTQAENIILKTAKSFPKNELAQQTAAELLEEQLNWEKAKVAYNYCVEINKKNAKCQMGLGRSLFQIGKYKEALVNFNAACKLDRSFISEYKKMATTLRLGNKETLASNYEDNISKCYD